MGNLSELIENDVDEKGFSHPQIEVWESCLNSKETSEHRVDFFRKRQTLGLGTPVLYLKWNEGGRTGASHHQYHKELDDFLYERKIRAKNLENESERGAYWLKGALLDVELEFGDGYFDSVLHDYVRTLAGEDPLVAKILASIHVDRPLTNPIYDRCKTYVQGVIKGYIGKLKSLGYKAAEVERIFVLSICSYLDERFHISVRESLGFK